MKRIVGIAALVLLFGCSSEPVDSRPSIVLVVFDTVRADAVSAYGEVEGTTPAFDALARDGVLYTRAYAPSPWTLPSHASLFTGLNAGRHGVGVAGQMGLPPEVTTIAERLHDAGYATAGFSENPLIGAAFAMNQGFERFSSVTVKDVVVETWFPGSLVYDVVQEVESFVKDRQQSDDDRPFFLFVNLFDSHNPYQDREVDAFLPAEVDAGRTWPTDRLAKSANLLCDKLPPSDDLEALWGLYLGDVASADAKLGEILQAVGKVASPERLIAVATSDHGELFGEQRMLDHEFSVRAPVLRIPLVVRGAPGDAAARVDTPVELADVAASVLAWAGVPGGSEIQGQPLPMQDQPAENEREIVALYSDSKRRVPDNWDPDIAQPAHEVSDAKRAGCGPEDRVFGAMLALTRWPHKLIWYERYPPQLYDLSWDPNERSELSAVQPKVLARLLKEAEALVTSIGLDRDMSEAPQPSAEALEALRGLGYLDPVPGGSN